MRRLRVRWYWNWRFWAVGVLVRVDPLYAGGRNVALYFGPAAVEVTE